MASRTYKQLSEEEKWERDRPRIHALKNNVMSVQPGYTDDNYRDLVLNVSSGRTDSSKGLTEKERYHLIQRLQELVGDEAPRAKKTYPGKPKNMAVPERQDLLEKIEACLTARSLPWAYAEGMAKKICKKEKLEFCGPRDLLKIVAAFGYDAKRKGLRK